MNLTFFIKTSRKLKKFTSAVTLDEYVKKYNLPGNAQIIMKDDNNNTIGTMLVKTYKNLENENN